MFFIKYKVLNIFGFVGHTGSLAYSLFLTALKLYKKISLAQVYIKIGYQLNLAHGIDNTAWRPLKESDEKREKI